MIGIDKACSTRLITTSESRAWETALPGSRSAFGSVQFATAVEKHTGYKACLFVLERGNERVAYPFFLRPVATLPFATGVPAFDIMTPEYTGPIAIGEASDETIAEFVARFSHFCAGERIIAEFAHLHPFACLTGALSAECIAANREIVYVDLTLPADEMWRNSFAHACRKNINRARQEGVQTAVAETVDDVKEFHRIYLQTMERNHARAEYRFPLEYFLDFFFTMGDNARFVLARHRDQTIAGTLYLHDDDDVYSYLGGADHAFQNMRPTNAVVLEVIDWGRRCGKKRLVLGGGYAPDDGIYRFKATFSPLRATFRIYRRVHMPAEYGALCRQWAAHHLCDQSAATYFPAYRSSAPAAT